MERSDLSVTVPGDVCAPGGFRAAGIHCGIKQDRTDLALLYSERPETSAAALFTTNRVRAAPVRYSQKAVAGGRARAIVVNSGNANACTGRQGMEDTREMASLTARALSVPVPEVLVASTGIIGEPLPMDAIRRGIPRAADELQASGDAAAEAILTTDRYPKTASISLDIEGRPVTIGGMAKGAGMIHPKMATTLGFLTTDAPVGAGALRDALRVAVDRSFNRITVDGETSTNDAVFVLANGAAGGPGITRGDELEAFTEALAAVAERLARMVPRDGEGATKLVRIRVEGAGDDAQARRCADRVANSLLVKTALRGEDPNWGRIMAAVGDAGIELTEEATDIWIGDVHLVRGGIGVPENLERARDRLREENLELRIVLDVGSGAASVWTCDLGEEYVRINTEYN